VVRIRLRRMGAKKRPFYRIVVADKRTSRDGRFIENIGTYDPNTDPPTIKLNKERAEYWLSVGADPSDTARGLLKVEGFLGGATKKAEPEKKLKGKAAKAAEAAKAEAAPPAEEAKAEEPKAEEPKVEEAVAEEVKAKAPKAKEPKAEEPEAEEAAAEEPKAEEAPAEEKSE